MCTRQCQPHTVLQQNGRQGRQAGAALRPAQVGLQQGRPDGARHAGQCVAGEGLEEGSVEAGALGQGKGKVRDAGEEALRGDGIEHERRCLATVPWVARAPHQQAHQRAGMEPALKPLC